MDDNLSSKRKKKFQNCLNKDGEWGDLYLKNDDFKFITIIAIITAVILTLGCWLFDL